jgi:CheY-like chemotaxis protein
LARILVADDDPDIRELARLLLVRHGHQVVTAVDGEEAIAMLPSVIPAMVITDLIMPQQDGFAVCVAVRSSPTLQNVPVVLLTALPSGDARVVEAAAHNNAVFLAKTDISRLGDLADSLVDEPPASAVGSSRS